MPRRRPNPPPISSLPPAFWRWFRGSVVVDEAGAPRVVYHGTRSPRDFLVFATGTQRDEDGEQALVTSSRDPSAHLGSHFTESRAVASRFAEGQAASWDRARYVHRDEAEAGGRVIPVYLAIRNPKVFPSDRSLFRWIVRHGESSSLDEQIELDAGEDGDEEVEIDHEDLDVRLAALEHLREATDQGSGEFDGYDAALAELGASAAEVLRERGYDGVKYHNDIEGGGWSWVPLGRGQIKSALGRLRDYDPEDDSILA